MNLNSKTAIITGVSRGLGKATAEALVKKGVTVYGISRSESDLEAMARAWGDLFEPVILDITEEEKVRSWVSESFSEANPPDILKNLPTAPPSMPSRASAKDCSRSCEALISR